MALKFKVFTLLPECFPGVLGASIPGRALSKGLWQLETVNIRDFSQDKRLSVDDYPFGGGAGMVMRADVLARAVELHLEADAKSGEGRPLILLMSAKGYELTQKACNAMGGVLQQRNIYIICGRFEGIDQRFIDKLNVLEVSLGKFVLFGGEVAAMAICEAVVRLLPGILGSASSLSEESYALGTEFENLAEYPQYTQPREWMGAGVPDVLLSGNHQLIAKWRLHAAISGAQRHQQKCLCDVISAQCQE